MYCLASATATSERVFDCCVSIFSPTEVRGVVLDVSNKLHPGGSRRLLLFPVCNPADFCFFISPATDGRWKVAPVPLWDATYLTPGRVIVHLGDWDMTLASLRTLSDGTLIGAVRTAIEECAPEATWVTRSERIHSVTVLDPGKRFDTGKFSRLVAAGLLSSVLKRVTNSRADSVHFPWPSTIERAAMANLDADIAAMCDAEAHATRSKLKIPTSEHLKASIMSSHRWRKDGSITFSYTWKERTLYDTFALLKTAVDAANPEQQQQPETIVIDIDDTPGPSQPPNPKRRRDSALDSIEDLLSAARTEMQTVLGKRKRLKSEVEQLKKVVMEREAEITRLAELLRGANQDLNATKFERDALKDQVTNLQQESRGGVRRSDPFEVALGLLAKRTDKDMLEFGGYMRSDERLGFALASTADSDTVSAFHTELHDIFGSVDYLAFLKTLFFTTVFKDDDTFSMAVSELLYASGIPAERRDEIMAQWNIVDCNRKRRIARLFARVRNSPTQPDTMAKCMDTALLLALESLIST